MRPATITGTLFGVIFALQLVSLVVVIQFTYSRLNAEAGQSAVHSLDTEAKNLVIQVQQFLSPITSQLSISRQLIFDGLLNTHNDKTLERYFLSQLRSNVAMNAMYLGRSDGSFVAVARFDTALSENYNNPVLRAKVVSLVDGVRKIHWREYTLRGERLNQWSDDADHYDPRVLAWYQDAQEHDRPVWTNAFSLTNSNKLAIAASVNLRDRNDKNAGVLGVSVELSELSALVSAVPISRHAAAVIMDDNRNKIALSIPDSHRFVDRRSVEIAAVSVSPDVSRQPGNPNDIVPNHLFLPPTNAASDVLSAIDRHWFSDNGSLAHVQRRITLFDGALQWRVVLAAPVSKLRPITRQVMMDGIIGALVIIVTPGLIAILIIMGLTKPLKRLYRRATIDFLTRAFNREEFINRFARCLSLSGNANSHAWVAVALDLDGFKQINDQHGHDAGDVILKTVVERLQTCVGRNGFVGRLGGDEFALALKIPPASDTRLFVEHIRRSVVKEPIRSAQAIHHIGMTAGVAIVDSDHESVVSWLERADKALVAGKAIAKNTTYCGVPVSVQSLPVRPLRSFMNNNATSAM